MAQQSHQHMRRAGILACLVVGGLFLAHSINAFVADALYMLPSPSQGQSGSNMAVPVSYSPIQAAEAISSSGLFLIPPPQDRSIDSDGPAGAPVRASLGAAAKIRLIGVVMGDRQGVFAVVEELASKKQSLYRLHDQIPDLGSVSEIRHDGIIIRQGNLEELLELGLSDKPITAANNSGAPAIQSSTPTGSAGPIRKVVDRREVESAMNDLPKLMTQARAVPNMVNGTVTGFRLDYVAPSSFYEKIGVQAGDVLQRVNGVDIRDPSTMLNLLQQLKNERTVKLDMVRNNQRSTVTYELR